MPYLFGNKIHELRKAKGLTLDQLASELGLSKGYLSEIETSRKRPPSDKIINKMARALSGNRKLLLRLAHIDKIAEDIKQELKLSTMILPPKLAQQNKQDISSLLINNHEHKRKDNVNFAGYIPVVYNRKQGVVLSQMTSVAEWENPEGFVQVNIPGLHILFALRMMDSSMEHRTGTSFRQNGLVLLARCKRVQPGDSLFVVYQDAQRICAIFRYLEACNRRRLYLVTRNSHEREETILPRKTVVEMLKAVAYLEIL
jgi:transcriptional regulator with XRE-family HTH domain